MLEWQLHDINQPITVCCEICDRGGEEGEGEEEEKEWLQFKTGNNTLL